METALPLNELELDALTELVNIGVSRAADSLREMVGEEIILSVPKVELLGRARARRRYCSASEAPSWSPCIRSSKATSRAGRC